MQTHALKPLTFRRLSKEGKLLPNANYVLVEVHDDNRVYQKYYHFTRSAYIDEVKNSGNTVLRITRTNAKGQIESIF